MVNHNINERQSGLQQISRILLINGGCSENPGLYDGQMGLILFFLKYARFTQNELYEEYSFDLIENLIEDKINLDSSIDYKNGLAGIGSAFEYLVQNGYIEADTDEILEDFDKMIFFKYNLSALSIERIMDIAFYAAWRFSGNSAQKDMIRQNVLPQLEQVMHKYSIIPEWNALLKKSKPDFLSDKTHGNSFDMNEKNNYGSIEISIHNGLAGWGMSFLTELDGDDSWFSLFPNNFMLLK